MKRKLRGLARRYEAALRVHLHPRTRGNFEPAGRLGRQAVVLGLETLELARIHEQAVVMLNLSRGRKGPLKRAEAFFAEALAPIVETHRAARRNQMDLHRLKQTLGQRTLELAATNRALQRGIVRRENVESALKRSGVRFSRLLKDSLQLREGLRQLTHRLLAAQEEERQKISHELQDEIAQTLLGINVRLLALKREARAGTTGLRKEIASTQALVLRSAQSVRRAARRFRKT